jgi:2-phosphosulfolactate phosphatase
VRADVCFGVGEATQNEIAGRVVAVIDVLRASTTVAVALANGAKAVVPCEGSEEAITRAKSFERDDVRLAGERRMRAIPGFDLGNSPAEFTRSAVDGKTIVLATTNGTVAVASLQGARDVVVASYVNYSVILALLRAALRGGTDVTLLCAGRDKQFSLEDSACAGRFVRGLARDNPGIAHNDAAQACAILERPYADDLARLFADSEHGRALADAGFASDLEMCATLDAYPVVPVYRDRQITKVGASIGAGL